MARIVSGLASTIKDVLEIGRSVLLVGPPGRGKTTLLRDIARMLASEPYGKRVMIVDTNNEIAGEGVQPHRAIGDARRMKVGDRSQQYRRMLEAVQNHTPETLVIDEIGTAKEVKEAVGVQQRGVQLIATTHGRTLADVILNPDLRGLLGGVNTVILSAGERIQDQATSKTRNERKMTPTFDVCIELLGLHKWRLHYNVAGAVDAVLRQLGEVVDCEVRELHPETGIIKITHEPVSSPFCSSFFHEPDFLV
jgi:stage III sporulation protein SpoIIIAA